MRRALRFLLVGLAALIVVAGLAAGAHFMPATSQSLSRREMMLGVLTLGVLAIAAFGFDLRDWI